MRYLDLTLPSGAENLALDEALLEVAESAGGVGEVLRFWEPDRPMVVVGRSSKIDAEVRLGACRELEIPVYRRISGGAAIVTGPGCLMYAVVLSLRKRPGLRAVNRAHEFVLGMLTEALEPLEPAVMCRGISDLAVGQLKVSGNSIRSKRDHLLYHGTLLYDFPQGLLDRCLAMPPRQPAYRNDRSHGRFVTDLGLAPEAIRRALVEVFGADQPYDDWPRELTAQLAAEKYGRSEWNERQ